MAENEQNRRENGESQSSIASAGAGALPKEKAKRQFGKKLTDNHDEIKSMLRKSCFITDIAEKFGVHRETMVAYIKDNEDLEAARVSGINALTDKYEARLHELAFREQELVATDEGGMVGRHDGKVMATNFNAVKFWLQQRAADRGYGAKIETNEVGNGRIPIIIAGDFTEDEIAEAEKQVTDANVAARADTEG